MLRVARNSLFILACILFGLVSSDVMATELMWAPVVLFGLLLAVFLEKLWYEFAETDIWSNVTKRAGLEQIDGLSVNFSKLPKKGRVLGAGVQDWNVEAAYRDPQTNGILQRVQFVYGGMSGSRVSFATRHIVMIIPLPIEVPDIFVDGLKRNKFKKSTEMWVLNKKLLRSTKIPDLEGDFGKYFTVYASEGSQLDGFTILAPDVMVQLRDEGYDFDYELSGHSLCVIRDANITNEHDLAQFVVAARACAREFVPQIAGHTFTYAPPLPVQPWRTVLWGYLYTLRMLGKIAVYVLALSVASAWLADMLLR